MRSILLIPFVFGLNAFAALIATRLPSLIIPLNKFYPDTPQNTQKKAFVEHAINTEISFDVPSNSASRCKIGFYISTDPTRGAPWELWGAPPLTFNIWSLEPRMNEFTDTWNNHPQSTGWVATVEVGNSGVISIVGGDVVCAKGQIAQFFLTPASGRDFGLNWFQLSDPLHGITYEMYA